MRVAGCKNSHNAFIRLTQCNPSLNGPFHLLTGWQQSLFTDRLSQQPWRNTERGRLGKFCGHLAETQAYISTADFLGGLGERLYGREPDENISRGEGLTSGMGISGSSSSTAAVASSVASSSAGSSTDSSTHPLMLLLPPPRPESTWSSSAQRLCVSVAFIGIKDKMKERALCIIYFMAKSGVEVSKDLELSSISALYIY